MSLIKVIGYTVFMYFYLIFIIRLMGKREVGSLSIFDLAVYFTISDLITMSIIDQSVPFVFSLISVLILCFLQICISHITLKYKKVRDLIEGKKSLIINDGKIDFNEMKKQRFSIDDLYVQIRLLGIDSITKIRWAILETNGKLSVIKYEDSISKFPDPIIKDGEIDYVNMKKANIDEKYLLSKLFEINVYNIKDIKICLLLDDKLTFFF